MQLKFDQDQLRGNLVLLCIHFGVCLIEKQSIFKKMIIVNHQIAGTYQITKSQIGYTQCTIQLMFGRRLQKSCVDSPNLPDSPFSNQIKPQYSEIFFINYLVNICLLLFKHFHSGKKNNYPDNAIQPSYNLFQLTVRRFCDLFDRMFNFDYMKLANLVLENIYPIFYAICAVIKNFKTVCATKHISGHHDQTAFPVIRSAQ